MGEEEGSSVLFSLHELQRMETERIQEEEQAAQDARLRSEAEAQAIADRARQDELERIRAREEEARRLERERIAHEAKLRAIHQAEVERARIVAAHEAESVEADKRRRHEVEIAQIEADRSRSSLKKAVWGLAIGAAVVGATSVAAYALVLAPEWERERAIQQAELDRKAQDLQETQRAIDDNQRARDGLVSELDRIQAEMEDLAKQPPPASTASAASPPRGLPWVAPKPPKTDEPAPQDCGDEHDPLNPCLP